MVIIVKDIMTKKVVAIDGEKSAKQAGELMAKTRRGSIIVTRKNKPVGIISDSDLIKRIVAKNLPSSKVKIKNVMSKPLITIKPEDEILLAVKKMKTSNIHRLPVVVEGRIVGMVSLTDIARTSPEMVDLLEYRLKMKETPFAIKEKFTSGVCDSCGNYSDDMINIDDQWLCEDCREEAE
jgi:CBS domain-containing protein